MTNSAGDEPPKEESISLEEFLTDCPPNQFKHIYDMVDRDLTHPDTGYLNTPELLLHCENDLCKGLRVFESPKDGPGVGTKRFNWCFLHYRCKNCEQTFKHYSLLTLWNPEEEHKFKAAKLGEVPSFGPRIPSRVVSLIGPDRELFLQGHRAESQGMGIGAFAYYRRVVDNQKNRLLEQIVEAAKRLDVSPDDLKTLEAAAAMDEFSKALDAMKPVFPTSLKVMGHNPLRLLHKSLSTHIHEKSDEECLQLAKDIRLVLTDLADKIGQALKDKNELEEAVKRLMISTQKKKEKADKGSDSDSNREEPAN